MKRSWSSTFIITWLRTVTILFYLLMFVTLPFPGFAQQVNTNISPTIGSGNLGTMINPIGNTFNITGGTRPNSGLNLFHSFEQFSIGTGDSANFANDTGLATTNILSRVTGGTRSDIFGAIRTTGFPGANFFLINPAGVMFGHGASLDVEGSFHVSTADSIKLQDGVLFNATPSSADAMLTTAQPDAFGFLDKNSPASIDVNGGDLRLSVSESLSLVSSGVVKVSSGIIDAPNGKVNIVHVMPGSESSIDTSDLVQTVQSPDEPNLPTDFDAQHVFIRAEALIVSSANSSGNARVGQSEGDITVDVGRIELRDGGSIDSSNISFEAGKAGDITVKARDSVSIRGTAEAPSLIAAIVLFAGEAGRIEVETSALTIEGENNVITTSAILGGKGGDIHVEADTIELRSGARVTTTNLSDQPSGNITVIAKDSLLIKGDVRTGLDSVAGFGSTASGDAGRVVVESDSVHLQGEGAAISTRTEGMGDAGKVELIVGKQLQLSDGSSVSSSATSTSEGSAGTVSVTAQQVDIQSSEISTSTSSVGAGGNLNIHATNVLLTNGGSISAESLSTGIDAGESGSINIEASDTLGIFNGSSVSVETQQATAGDINLEVGSLLHLNNQGSITTSARGGDGDGGDINIDPIFVILEGGSRIVARAERGRGGNINIVTDFLFQSPDSVIDASSEEGIDGTVEIDSPDTDVIAGALELPEAFTNVAAILGERCGARLAKGSSSFVLGGHGGIPPNPETMIPGSLMDTDLVSVPSNGTTTVGTSVPTTSDIASLMFDPITMGCVTD